MKVLLETDNFYYVEVNGEQMGLDKAKWNLTPPKRDPAQEEIRRKVSGVVNPKLPEMIYAYEEEYGPIIIEGTGE